MTIIVSDTDPGNRTGVELDPHPVSASGGNHLMMSSSYNDPEPTMTAMSLELLPDSMWLALMAGTATFCALGTAVNVFVLYLGGQLARERGLGSQIIVLTMTTFDLISCLVFEPLRMVRLTVARLSDLRGFCSFYFACWHFSTVGSSLTLLLLNADRFLRLYKPLHYPHLVDDRRKYSAISGILAVTSGWSLFVWLHSNTTECRLMPCCQNPLALPSVHAYYAMLFVLLPNILSVGLSVATAVIVYRNFQGPRQLIGRRCSEQSVSAGVLDRMRRILFVFSTTIWSSLVCLPANIGRLVSASLDSQEMTSKHLRTMVIYQTAFAALESLNPIGNPCITMLTQRHYTNFVSQNFQLVRVAVQRWTLIGRKLIAELLISFHRRRNGDHPSLVI